MGQSLEASVIALKLKRSFLYKTLMSFRLYITLLGMNRRLLLYLGVKNIHLGPTLPAFFSPNVKNVLVDTFGLSSISTVEEDLAQFCS